MQGSKRRCKFIVQRFETKRKLERVNTGGNIPVIIDPGNYQNFIKYKLKVNVPKMQGVD